jgi:membrane protein required for colicin V production
VARSSLTGTTGVAAPSGGAMPALAGPDLALLALVLAFALWGAFQGAARQIAQSIAAVGAWFAARPAGDFLGPIAAEKLDVSLLIGNVLSTFVSFLVVFVVVRLILTLILRRVLSGKEPGNRGLDRTLGFFIGGAKVAALAWVMICALSFVEDNVTLQGKKFGFVPKDSLAFTLARKYNLFEMSQFSGVSDAVRVAGLRTDPKTGAKLKANTDFQALLKDPRFAAMLDSAAMKKALGSGDTRALLQNDQVLELLQDPLAMKRMSRIAELSEQ